MDKQVIADIRQKAQDAIDREIELDISGSDIDARLIETAKKNALAAGVEADIQFKQKTGTFQSFEL